MPAQSIMVSGDQTIALMTIPKSPLGEEMRARLESPLYKDITFVTGDEKTYTAHKIIVFARAPRLAIELFPAEGSAAMDQIQIDISSPVFQELLSYIYTDRLSPSLTEKELNELLHLAEVRIFHP
jgi:hypothetical protein